MISICIRSVPGTNFVRNISLRKNILHSFVVNNHFERHLGKCSLYTKNFLGIDNFLKKRSELTVLSPTFIEDYRENIPKYGSNAFIKLQHLIAVMHLSQPTDVNMVMKMFWRYYNSTLTEEPSFFNKPESRFGPLIMRMLWHHKLSDEAIRVMRFPPFQHHLQQSSSFFILFDLLLAHQCYEDIIDIYENIYLKNIPKRSSHVLTYVLAACYYLDTKKSCKDGLNFVKEYINETGREPSTYNLGFLIMMLIRREELSHAMQVLEGNEVITKSLSLQNLWVVLLAKSLKVKELILALQDYVYKDIPNPLKKNILLIETMDYVNETAKYVPADDRQRIQLLVTILNDQKLIIEKSLEDQLLQEIKDFTPNYIKNTQFRKYV